MKKNYKDRLGFTKINYVLLLVAVVVIGIGYGFMKYGTQDFGDDTISPVLLTIGYIILFPLGILYKKKDNE